MASFPYLSPPLSPVHAPRPGVVRPESDRADWLASDVGLREPPPRVQRDPPRASRGGCVRARLVRFPVRPRRRSLLHGPVRMAPVPRRRHRLRRVRGEIPGIRRAAAVLSAALGLPGFVVGMASLPWAFPARVSSFFCAYEWECLLYGWFPYVPTVFAAVVVSHAAVAGIAGGQCRDGAAARRLRAAAVILILVSLVSLMAQFAGAFHGWAWGLVGLTAPGYLVAVAGAWRESRARATATPSPDPGGPSRGPSR